MWIGISKKQKPHPIIEKKYCSMCIWWKLIYFIVLIIFKHFNSFLAFFLKKLAKFKKMYKYNKPKKYFSLTNIIIVLTKSLFYRK